MTDKIVKFPKHGEKRELAIKHAYCSGPCWGSHLDGEHPLIEFMLSRILFSLLEKGHSPDSAINEIAEKLYELSAYDRDPYGHIDLEMSFEGG